MRELTTLGALNLHLALALKCNPLIIEMLWTEPNHVVRVTDDGWMLRAKRDLFLSKEAYHTFGGYAASQLFKIENRNPEGKRKEIVEKHGYDTKHGMHLVRLLKMGIEVLMTGELRVQRPDRKELMRIREGKVSLEELMEQQRHLKNLLDEALVKSELPDKPPYEETRSLLIEMMELRWM